MNIILPPKLRQAIYIVATVAGPTMFYLNKQGTVSDFIFGLFTVVMGAITTLAAVNVDTSA